MSDQQMRFYSIFCSISYLQKEKRPKQILSFTLLDNYNGDESCLYVNEDSKVLIYIIRGTNNIKDLLTDLSIVTGTEKYSKRYLQELKRYNIMKNAFIGYKICLTGHSLGGRLCIALTRAQPDSIHKTFAYNTGSSPIHMVESMKDMVTCKIRPNNNICKSRKKIILFNGSKDIISLFSAFESSNVTYTKGFHSINQFL